MVKRILETLPGSFDVIGTIAILPQETKHAKLAAETLLLKHKNIRTVMIKVEKVKGRLRKRKLKFLAGAKKKETIHKENGCLIKLNVEDCYFSPRLSNDRLQIARQVKKGEKVLVMFGGVAPYALVIAKNSKASSVYSIEISKKASLYAKENAAINKLYNVIVLQGDVKRIVPKVARDVKKFDRIVMPRPQLREAFLSEAFAAAKKGCIIHFYDFLREHEIPHTTVECIREAAKKARRKVKILGWKKAGEIAPYKYRVRVDFKVN